MTARQTDDELAALVLELRAHADNWWRLSDDVIAALTKAGDTIERQARERGEAERARDRLELALSVALRLADPMQNRADDCGRLAAAVRAAISASWGTK